MSSSTEKQVKKKVEKTTQGKSEVDPVVTSSTIKKEEESKDLKIQPETKRETGGDEAEDIKMQPETKLEAGGDEAKDNKMQPETKRASEEEDAPEPKKRRTGTTKKQTPLEILDTFLPLVTKMASAMKSNPAVKNIEADVNLKRLEIGYLPTTFQQKQKLTIAYFTYVFKGHPWIMKKHILTNPVIKVSKQLSSILRAIKNKAATLELQDRPVVQLAFIKTLMTRANLYMANALVFYEQSPPPHNITLNKQSSSILESALNRPHRVTYWAIKMVYDDNVGPWEEKHESYLKSMNPENPTLKKPIVVNKKRMSPAEPKLKQTFNVFIAGSWLQRSQELKALGPREAIKRLSMEWKNNQANIQQQWADITSQYNTQIASNDEKSGKEQQKQMLNDILSQKVIQTATSPLFDVLVFLKRRVPIGLRRKLR